MSTPSRKPSVKLIHGQATTTSLKLSDVFGKRHRDVMRAIENMECTPDFRKRNFAFSSIEMIMPNGGTRTQPMYTITRDGFTFLACGFTGKEAAQWKEKYIEAFNELERRALEKAAAKAAPKTLPLVQKPLPALPGAKYHYPRNLLNQPYFTSPKTGETTLNISVLTSGTYVSPLMALLNQMRSEGHEVTAPFDEALALRKALIKSGKVLDDIQTQALMARHRSAES